MTSAGPDRCPSRNPCRARQFDRTTGPSSARTRAPGRRTTRSASPVRPNPERRDRDALRSATERHVGMVAERVMGCRWGTPTRNSAPVIGLVRSQGVPGSYGRAHLGVCSSKTALVASWVRFLGQLSDPLRSLCNVISKRGCGLARTGRPRDGRHRSSLCADRVNCCRLVRSSRV